MIVEEPEGATVMVVWHTCRYCLRRVETNPTTGEVSHYDNVTDRWSVGCIDGHGNDLQSGTEACIGSTLILYTWSAMLPAELGGEPAGDVDRVPEHGGLPWPYDPVPAGRHART